jgi:hypothetical protein
MKRMIFPLFWRFLLCLCYVVSCFCSSLTTFHPSSLNIRLREDSAFSTGKNVISEAIHLLKNHFLYRDRYEPTFWETVNHEISQYNDERKAMEELTKRLNEPYTRYIDHDSMKDRRQSLAGTTAGIGIKFKRYLRLDDYKYGLKTTFLPSKEAVQAISSWCNNCVRNIMRRTPTTEVVHSRFGKFIPVERTEASVLVKNNSASPNSKSEVFRLSKSYLTLLSPSLLSFSLLSKSIPSFSISSNKLLFASVTLSSTLLSAAFQIIPYIYPFEVCSVSTKTSRTSDIKVGDKLLSINNNKIPIIFSVKKLKETFDVADAGEVFDLEVVRKCTDIVDDSSRVSSCGSWNKWFSKISPNNRMRIVSCSQPRRLSFSDYKRMSIKVIKDYCIDTNKLIHHSLPPSQGKGLGYVKIKEFNDRTFEEFQLALNSLNRQLLIQQSLPLQALLIDLRNNPGGPVSPALDIAAFFLRNGKPILQMKLDGKNEIYYCRNPNPDERTSVCLLTDSNTASASEMLIEALRTNCRATSMGKRTLGKNVAQVVSLFI